MVCLTYKFNFTKMNIFNCNKLQNFCELIQCFIFCSVDVECDHVTRWFALGQTEASVILFIHIFILAVNHIFLAHFGLFVKS